jgi:hypothetical protein
MGIYPLYPLPSCRLSLWSNVCSSLSHIDLLPLSHAINYCRRTSILRPPLSVFGPFAATRQGPRFSSRVYHAATACGEFRLKPPPCTASLRSSPPHPNPHPHSSPLQSNDASINWEESVCLNIVMQVLKYKLVVAICTTNDAGILKVTLACLPWVTAAGNTFLHHSSTIPLSFPFRRIAHRVCQPRAVRHAKLPQHERQRLGRGHYVS